MELLIIKTGTRYIRVRENRYLEVGMDKASVFPMDKKDHVRSLADDLRKRGFKAIAIKKLILTEEDFQ